MLRPWKLYALEVEKRMLGVILMQGEHLEVLRVQPGNHRLLRRGVMFAFWRLGGQSSEPGPAGRGAQCNVLQGTKCGSSVL